MKSDAGIWGQATVRLLGPDGELKFYEVRHNLITTAGDKYYAQRAANGVAGNTDNPTAANGMKLGNGVTAVAKSGAGSAITTGYIAGSNNPFDSAATSAVGSDTGWKVRYTVTWAAGDATDTAITEAVICNDQATDAASAEADSYARVKFTAINKGVNDTLVINWDHTFFDSNS